MLDKHLEVFKEHLDNAITQTCNEFLQLHRKKDEDYDDALQRISDLSKDLYEVLEGTGPVTLTASEHEKLKEYIRFEVNTHWDEVKYAYLMGMRDRYVMPKMLGCLTD